MKKLLLSLGALSAVVAPVAAVVACGSKTETPAKTEEGATTPLVKAQTDAVKTITALPGLTPVNIASYTGTITKATTEAAVAAVVTDATTYSNTQVAKADVQEEFVSGMTLVDSSSTAWIIPEGSKLLKLADGADAATITKEKIEGGRYTQNGHAVVFKDAMGANKDLAVGNESLYTWTIGGDKTSTYKITSVHIDGESAYGVLEETTGKQVDYYGFTATKETEGVILEHEVTGLFYYSTAVAFAKNADQIKLAARGAKPIIKHESLSDEQLVQSFQGALVEVGLTKPTA